jgi:hypothetical protein
MPNQNNSNQYTDAQAAAEAGIAHAADHANHVAPGWIFDATESLRLAIIGFDCSKEFTIEQLREHCTNVPAPPDLRAWGAVTRRATKIGYIVKTGNFAIANSSNNSPKPLYRAGSLA